MRLPALALTCSLASAARAEQKNGAMLPAAPPVNVHTSETAEPYWGVGYLRFMVALPYPANPGFTLGDEDATWNLGNARYSADGLAYARGRPGPDRSREDAFIAGRLGSELGRDGFEKLGVEF